RPFRTLTYACYDELAVWRNSKRRGIAVAFVLMWSAHTHAGTITMMPNPVNCGSTDINTTTAAVTGSLSDSANDHVDLVLGTCSGSGAGTFALSPNNNIFLNNPASISVTYSPTARGTLTCTINVKDHGSTTVYGSFQVTGTGTLPQSLSLPTTSASFGNV